MKTVQIENVRVKNDAKAKGDEKNESSEAGVAGEPSDAAASAAVMAKKASSDAEAEAKAKALKILDNAEAEAAANAREIIERAEEQANAGAAEIIDAAHREAQEAMLAAREQIDEERSKAREEGYAQGAEEGKHSYDERLEEKSNELEAEYGEKLREDDEALKRVINELYDERTRTYESLEGQVVDLALDIVKKVLNPSEEETSGVFLMLIKNALKQINPDKKIIIRVGPVEFERFFPSGGSVFELDGGVKMKASILRDASLEEGDCIIDTEGETINAGINSQLKHVELAFDRAESI